MAGVADEGARQTLRFQRECIARALDSGCKPAADALKRAGASVSDDSIARYVKAAAARQVEANLTRNDVRVLAVDDINLRKGDKSSGCTVFLDAETHRVLIIVRGTTKAVVKSVLEAFPAATFFSRDRASAYASAAAECGITQIADRFHLIENAHQAVADALMTILPATIFLRKGDGWVPADPGTGRLPGRPVFTVPEDQVDDRIQLARLTPKQAQKYRHTQIHVRIPQAHDTQNQRANRGPDSPPQTLRPRARPSQDSIVAPYRDIVIRALQHGGTHRTIHPLLQQQGFAGSVNAVYQYILKLHQEIPETLRPPTPEPPPDPPAALQLQQISRDTVYKQVLKQAADSRPNTAEPQPDAASTPDSAPQTRRGASSPFSDKARTLIFGETPAADATPSVKRRSDQDSEQKKTNL